MPKRLPHENAAGNARYVALPSFIRHVVATSKPMPAINVAALRYFPRGGSETPGGGSRWGAGNFGILEFWKPEILVSWGGCQLFSFSDFQVFRIFPTWFLIPSPVRPHLIIRIPTEHQKWRVVGHGLSLQC